MDPNKLVWFPDTKHGYSIGRIVDISQANVSVQPLATPSSSGVHYELISSDFSATSTPTTLEFPYKSVYPCDQIDLERLEKRKQPLDNIVDVDDNCALINLNEAALLENVRVRFQRDKIYTYVAHILIAVNPYFEIRDLHSPEAILNYQGKSLGTMPPHVYAIADKAYRDMKALKQSQSIIINGESGAGKTESQKYVLRYLCLSGSQSGRLEKLILDANPLLEAFGNAKTIRNNNSSRFGKFIEIHYSNKFVVSGGLFFHYLLEKSRICTQSAGERNYHIFYQLCACLPKDKWEKLSLSPVDQFHYLKNGCTQYFCSSSSDKSLARERKSRKHLESGAIQDQLIDDLKCFEQTERALKNFGVSETEKDEIYSIVAAVLHLGNISFCEEPDDSRGGCRVEASAEKSLEVTAKLMKLDKELLRQALVSRIMSTTRGGHKGTVYMVQLSVQQAQNARDALAKAIYSRLFEYIVTKVVNKAIPFSSSAYYIGVLDVAGFEYFQHNSFEQFLINFCNEKLQQFFNERILKEEQVIYEKEGLQLERVQFTDNQDCIQLFEAKAHGIFDLLDEESRLPKPSAQHFTQAAHTSNKGHFRLAVPRTSKLKWHRELRDDEGFLVRHFAGAVCYETSSFIDKNNDALHASLRNLMLESEQESLRELFAGARESPSSAGEQGANNQQHQVLLTSATASPSPSNNKLNFISVGTTFRWQLNELLAKLRSTGSHFVRCIKPNGEMVAHKFEGAQILSQLHCSGMDSVLRLMQRGYPSRASFADLYQTYRPLLPAELARLDSHLFCRALFKALGLADADFRFGSSKVFFRPGKFAQFDQLLRSDREHLNALVSSVSRWLIRARWRKVQFCSLAVIKLREKILYRRHLLVGIQRHWRQALVARRLRFRLAHIRLARALLKSLNELEQQVLAAGQPMRQFEQKVRELRQRVSQFEKEIRAELGRLAAPEGARESAQESAKARADQAGRLEALARERDSLLSSLRESLAQQRELAELERRLAQEKRKQREQDRLAQEAAERELKLKESRAELERRRQEELLRAQQKTASTNHLSALPGAQQKLVAAASTQTDSLRDGTVSAEQFEEQEQRDYEIALRLARETPGGQQVQHATPTRREGPPELYPSTAQGHAGSGKYELTRWKYSELRDTINTSCDLELLEACKREFHRRLKVYHAWRAANCREPASGRSEERRAPGSVMAEATDSADNSSSGSGSPASSLSRLSLNEGQQEQRYFRIPFVKTSASSGARGWWFAHFDGQWIARQLELHPNKEPLLLIAGQHDIEMCELSLKETRLTSKRGAEILPQEFEEEWQKHGGQAYCARTTTTISQSSPAHRSS